MLIGSPKEIKGQENRVGMTPTSVRETKHHGHRVVVQAGMGAPIGFEDDAYRRAGAEIASADEIWARADMIVKVKEPQASEYKLIRPGQILFTYLHLAPDLQQTKALVESGAIAIAYETVTDDRGGLPLLTPMSEVAGRMSIQVGARCLEMTSGGRGMLLGGVPGVPAAHVVILGGGIVGTNAARMAMGLEAKVTVIDKSLRRLYDLDLQFGTMMATRFATVDAIEECVLDADLVIGAVLIPGAAAPRLVTRAMVKQMKRGSVLVDVSIDQGGCFETSRPTSHANPTYVVDDTVHYCVTNMPAAVARTATQALNNATLPFVLALADKGYARAMKDDPHLLNGLNVHRGSITYDAVAEAIGLDHVDPLKAIGTSGKSAG
ncbi:MAG: alanine dehydrogenase [Alphaproteobacteria bacterium]|nr:alanine dehydrogenase [Alphaproteobacteria bacterium]